MQFSKLAKLKSHIVSLNNSQRNDRIVMTAITKTERPPWDFMPSMPSSPPLPLRTNHCEGITTYAEARNDLRSDGAVLALITEL
jgi:hypothetical protein